MQAPLTYSAAASYTGNLETAKELIENGFTPRERSEHFGVPLQPTGRRGDKRIVLFLLQHRVGIPWRSCAG